MDIGNYPHVKQTDHSYKLKSWRLDERVRRIIENTSLYRFASNVFPIRLDHNLLSFLCHSYDIVDNCFHIGSRRLYLGLEDIFYLTGLPINGKAVIASDIDVQPICNRLLGIAPGGNRSDFFLRELKPLENVPDDCENIELYVRAYLLYVLGCVLVPRNNQVPGAFVRLLEDTSSVDGYAWGSAMLAYLHIGLHKVKEGKKNILGSSVILQLFALERLPQLAEYYGLKQVDFPRSFPLIGSWASIIAKKCRDNMNRINTEQLVQPVDSQVIIEWRPYAQIEAQEIPDDLIRQLNLIAAQVDLICMNIIWRYDYRQCGEQCLPMQPVEAEVVNVRPKARKGDPRDWPTYYKDYVRVWDRVRGQLVVEPKDLPSIPSRAPSPTIPSPHSPSTCYTPSLPPPSIGFPSIPHSASSRFSPSLSLTHIDLPSIPSLPLLPINTSSAHSSISPAAVPPASAVITSDPSDPPAVDDVQQLPATSVVVLPAKRSRKTPDTLHPDKILRDLRKDKEIQEAQPPNLKALKSPKQGNAATNSEIQRKLPNLKACASQGNTFCTIQNPRSPASKKVCRAESPVSAYMRYLQNSISSADPNSKSKTPQFSGFSPLAPLVSPRWNNSADTSQQQPPPPASQQQISQPQPQFPFPPSPLPFGCLNSPRSPNPFLLFSPTSGQLNLPLSPTVPVPLPSPRWRSL